MEIRGRAYGQIKHHIKQLQNHVPHSQTIRRRLVLEVDCILYAYKQRPIQLDGTVKVLNLSEVYFPSTTLKLLKQQTLLVLLFVVIKKRRTSPARLNRVFRSPDCISLLCSAWHSNWKFEINENQFFSAYTQSFIHSLSCVYLPNSHSIYLKESSRLDNVNEPTRE